MTPQETARAAWRPSPGFPPTGTGHSPERTATIWPLCGSVKK
jgi:hypothetical protein